MSWRQTRLKHLCIDFGQYGLNISPEQYAYTGTRLIRTTDIKGGQLQPNNGVFVSSDVSLDERHKLRAGDLLLSRSGTLGQSYSVQPGDDQATYAGYLIRFRPRPEVDPRYLSYIAQSTLFQASIHAESIASTIQNFNAERYANISIIVPSSQDEQRRIADFLDAETSRIDRMQTVTRLQISLLSERLSESIRLATSVGRGPSRKTGIAWMPEMNESWHLVKVSHAFRTGSGTTPTSDRPEYFNGPHPWINSADINNSDIFTSEKAVTAKALSDFSTLKVHPSGSLVIALYGQGTTKGNVGILRFDACLNQACCALIPTGSIMAEYALYWFRAHKEGIVGLALGAGQPNLSQELIRQLKIPTPEPAEQRRIVSGLQAMEEGVQRRSSLLRSREVLLNERRQGLITAAVTGQIDVSTASGRGVDVG